MADLYGHPEAFNQAIMDQQSIQMNQLAMATNTIALEKSQIGLEQQKKMLELMRGADFKGKDPEELLKSLSKMELQSGNIEEGANLLEKANTFSHVKSEEEKNRLQTSIMEMTQAERILDGVNSPEEWEQAKSLVHAQGWDKDPQVQELLKLPYNPMLIGLIHDQVTSAKDKSVIEHNKALAREEDSAADLNEAKKATEAARKKRLEFLTKNHVKNGTVNTGKAPPASMVTAAKDLIDHDQRLSKSDLDITARRIAEDAQQLRLDDPTLTPTEATQKAYAAAKAEHRLPTGRPRQIKDGTEPSKPITLAPAGTPAERAKLKSTLIDNTWYTIPGGEFAGKPGLWDAKTQSFIPEEWLQQADDSTDDTDSSSTEE